MLKTWSIGSAEDCDLIVSLPSVSSRHGQLRQEQNRFILQDLKSTNGIYVDGVRLHQEVEVVPTNTITLGKTTRMPWPREAMGNEPTLQIGRGPENDMVVDAPMVSGLHARVGWSSRWNMAWIEDLGSANGTCLGVPGRTRGCILFSPDDTIYFGTHPVTGTWLSQQIDRLSKPSASGERLPRANEPLAASSTAPSAKDQSDRIQVPRSWRVAALCGQAALLGLMIAMAGRLQDDPISRAALIASLMGIASTWIGLSPVILDRVLKPRQLGGSSRFGWSTLLSVVGCVLAWGLVAMISGTRASLGSSLAILVFTAFVGQALGFLIVATGVSAPTTVVSAIALMAISALYGGGWSPTDAGSGFFPTRWAYEGLLWTQFPGAEPGPNEVESLRPHLDILASGAGWKVCMMALSFMIAGLALAVVVFTWDPEPPSLPDTRSPSSVV